MHDVTSDCSYVTAIVHSGGNYEDDDDNAVVRVMSTTPALLLSLLYPSCSMPPALPLTVAVLCGCAVRLCCVWLCCEALQ